MPEPSLPALLETTRAQVEALTRTVIAFEEQEHELGAERAELADRQQALHDALQKSRSQLTAAQQRLSAVQVTVDMMAVTAATATGGAAGKEG